MKRMFTVIAMLGLNHLRTQLGGATDGLAAERTRRYSAAGRFTPVGAELRRQDHQVGRHARSARRVKPGHLPAG